MRGVGVGPDWARVWTFPVGRKKLERMGTLWNREKKDGIKDIRGTTREEGRQDPCPGWAGSVRTLKNLWAGASTYEQEVLHPGPTGRSRKIYATPRRRKVKRSTSGGRAPLR